MTVQTVRQISIKWITAFAAVFSLLPLTAFAQAVDGKLAKFVPTGYRIVEEIKGDLNKDGSEDYVLIIKGTKNIAANGDCMEGKDCNRRGIIVAFNKGSGYELALENRSCFSPEEALPPHLVVRIKNGNLYIEYDLGGNFGYRSYTFRYRNSDFEFIGYDDEKMSGIVLYQRISVNFLTKKMKTEKRINAVAKEEYDEEKDAGAFKETWESITHKEPVKLRNITDFDDFDEKFEGELLKKIIKK